MIKVRFRHLVIGDQSCNYFCLDASLPCLPPIGSGLDSGPVAAGSARHGRHYVEGFVFDPGKDFVVVDTVGVQNPREGAAKYADCLLGRGWLRWRVDADRPWGQLHGPSPAG